MHTYWENISEINDKQRTKGIKEYGQTLEENKELSVVETLTMLEEELVDALNYIEKVKDLLQSNETPTGELLKLFCQYLRY